MSTGLLSTPALGPCRIDLWPYQAEAIEAVREEFVKGVKRTLLVLFTGGGKTIVTAMITRRALEKGGRVLFLAHTKELIGQTVNKFDRLGVEVGVEMAEQKARSLFEPAAVAASVASLHPKRLSTWPRDYFNLIICDEAHHSINDSYTRIFKYFGKARVLGVTATADRADEEDLGQVYESVAFEMNLWAGMTAEHPGPYLSRLRFVQCDVDIDLRDLRATNGDFTDADLEARIGPMVEVLANAVKQEIGGRKTLVFTPQIKSAQAMATALHSLGLKADWVSGVDPDRADKIQQFHDGHIQVLCNCAVLTEGFDCPDVSAIVLCRPTKSRPLFSQIVGRGTRRAEGKSDCIVVDFNYLTTKHKLVKPVELCDSNLMDQEVLDLAQMMLEKDKGLDLVDAIERAEKQHQEQQVLRVKARERNIKYRRVSYDPLSVCDAIGVPWRGSRAKDAVIDRATPAQVALMNKLGIDDSANLSRTRAKTVLDYAMSRAKSGLASVKQVSHLIARGVPAEQARAMTKAEASNYMTDVLGWQKRA